MEEIQEVVKEEKPNSYAQYRQDLMVIRQYNGLRGGYFVDLGAYDGKTLSNTFLLESEYDWKGIAVEPLPEAYKKCKESRSCIVRDDAISSTSGEMVAFCQSDMLSGIRDFHLIVDKDPDFIPRHFFDDEYKGDIYVATKTLNEVLDEENAPSFIHFLSIDVQGVEFEVIRVLDFSKYTFGVINISHNYQQPLRSNIRSFLEKKGYFFYAENNCDDVFIHGKTKF
jgi:FkbM family methyltransferase